MEEQLKEERQTAAALDAAPGNASSRRHTTSGCLEQTTVERGLSSYSPRKISYGDRLTRLSTGIILFGLAFESADDLLYTDSISASIRRSAYRPV